MKKQRNELIAGLFIIVCVVLIVAILIAIQGIGAIFEPMQSRVASFPLQDNVGGLRTGDGVRIGGYRVGTVRSIDLEDAGPDAKAPPRIIIHYSIPKKFVVHEDAKLAIETTVTGTSVLNFISLGTGKPLSPSQPLVGQPGTLQTIMSSLSSAAPELDRVLKEVQAQTLPKVNQAVEKYAAVADSFHKAGDSATALLTHLRKEVDPIIAHYHQVADSANSMLSNVGDLFGDVKGDFRGTVANLNQATSQLKTQLPGILDQANQLVNRLNATVSGINDSLADIQQTFANAEQLTGSARDILVANKTRITGMIDSLKKTSDNLKFASEEIRRSPWRLLYQPKPGEMANLNVFDAARQFAQGADAMADTAGALRDTLNLPHPDVKQVRNLMEQLNQSFTQFQSVEKKLWQAVKE